MIAQELLRIGVVRFGHFEDSGKARPIALDLGLLPSYPATLRRIAGALAPLVEVESLTHLLTTPAATPIGVALGLHTGLPVIYPAPGDPASLEGAYDYDVPTILLTDVLADGAAETRLIAHARKQGLDVEALVAVIDLGWCAEVAGARRILKPIALLHAPDLLSLSETISPSMRAALANWLHVPAR